MIFSFFIPFILFVKLQSPEAILQCKDQSVLDHKTPISYVLEIYGSLDLRNSWYISLWLGVCACFKILNKKQYNLFVLR